MLRLDDLRAQVSPELLIGILVAAVLLFALGGYLYGIKPSLLEYQRLREKRSAVSTGPEFDPEVKRVAIATHEARVGTLRDELYGGSSRVPARQIEAFVIDSLNRIAERRAVELVSVKPGAFGDVLSFEELPYDVRVQGGYFDLYDWLRDVETQLRPMVVKQFAMRPERESSLLALELRLVAYRAKKDSS
jgi:Tfp pilus assembly protein PilO